ncbi:MAG: hypothetical protein ACXV5U_09910 [Ilumatobacteraceae bacterium]
MMSRKKKRKRGGLKFLAVLFVIVATIVAVSTTRDSEFMKRVTGNREDRRVERTSVTPRFEFASATLQISIGEFYNNAGDPVDLTTTKDVSIDRQSSRAKADVKLERTSTEVAPGVNAVPFDAINASFTEILTKTKRYDSQKDPGQPWLTHPVGPYYYGTAIDEHFIPMIDDIMGFELRGLPSKPMVTEPTSGLKAGFKSSLMSSAGVDARPAVAGPTAPPAVTRSYTYQMDLATYRRAVPILASRTGISGPPQTPMTLTLGFDAVGLLRYVDIGMASSVASTLAQQFGPDRSAIYHYTMSVNVISGEPISIDIPTDVVDAYSDMP